MTQKLNYLIISGAYPALTEGAGLSRDPPLSCSSLADRVIHTAYPRNAQNYGLHSVAASCRNHLYRPSVQVAYTGLLQLFLTPQVIHLLVVDMPSVVGNIENGTSNPLEDLGALRWVRSLSFRVPGAAVILVGTMCDRVKDTDGETTEARLSRAAGMVEDNIRSWIHKWTTQRCITTMPKVSPSRTELAS